MTIIKNNYKIILSILIFLSFVFLFEGNGFIVHKLHYDNGGTWTASILNFDLNIKIAMYQLMIFTLLLYHKNIWLWLWNECFWFSCTQDIIFYIWGNFNFPKGDWTWMPTYNIFGYWKTQDQFVWSIIFNLLPIIAYVIIKKRKRDYHH